MNDLMSFGIHRLWKDHFTELVNFPPLQEAKVPAARRSAEEASAEAADCEAATPFAVLDLAGGTGDIAFRLIDRALQQLEVSRGEEQKQRQQEHGCSGVEVTVCDINAEMLRVGMTRACERGLPVRPLVDALAPCADEGEKDSNSSSKILLPRSSDFGRVGPVGLRWVRGSGECLPFAAGSFDLVTIAFGLRNFTSPSKGLREAMRVLKAGGRFLCLEFSAVENAVLKGLYDVYSFAALPLLGSAVAGDSGAYRYLAESIRRFPPQAELARMMQQEGFKHVSFSNMTGGVVAIHSGFKG
ncbi:uncharacterized protein LOC34622866 [Cyclospora cayetanensis]|nr:uncharacterized protein LOC34622866 [Cyclospora cayetanensis]